MKINQIVQETTTSGSVAPVEHGFVKMQTRNPGVYGNTKAGSLFKGKKTKAPYANSVNESAELSEADLQEDDIIVLPGQGRKLKTGFVPHGKSRVDHEVEMARSDVLATMKNARSIYELLKNKSEEEGLEGWVQEKLVKANDYLNSVKEYYDEKMMQQESVPPAGVIGNGAMGESSQRVDSLVTDALKIMRGSEASDAVKALKIVLGDREYSSRRGFYNFYIKQMLDMYGHQGLAEEEEDKIDSRFKKTEWMPLMDAIKILKHYGATPEKYMGHEMFPYYDIEGNRKYLEDITWNADNSKNVRVSLVNQAVRELKAQQQALAEGKIDFAKKLGKNIDKSNKAIVKTKKEVGSRVADIGAGGKEYNVKTDKAWDDAQKAKKAK
jgi:hypothetical protein